MSNITTNRVSAMLSDTELTSIKTRLNEVAALPFLLGLTVEERISLPKMNDSNKTFVEDSINAIVNNLHMMPAYFDAAELKKDLTLFMQLDEIALIIGQLYEKINDTMMQAGSEAYVTALTGYRLFNAAAIAGIPGADAIYQKLQVRFAEQGNFAKKDTPTDTSATGNTTAQAGS
jgi:hypothetical protein